MYNRSSGARDVSSAWGTARKGTDVVSDEPTHVAAQQTRAQVTPPIAADDNMRPSNGSIAVSALRLARLAPVSANTVFGPGCRPMFYTALLEQPLWLAWCAIPGVESCSVQIVDIASGAVVWSATGLDNLGYRWTLPELELNRGRTYEWTVHPIKRKVPDSKSENGSSFPDEPNTDRVARFWLLTPEERERFAAGLSMLRERSDPAFLSIAEALFLAEFQMYHHALTRIPIGRNTRNAAYAALHATARSVIFRQMTQHMKQVHDLAPCFREWAERNDQYHRDQAESRLPGARQLPIGQHNRRGPARRHRAGRMDSTVDHRQHVFT